MLFTPYWLTDRKGERQAECQADRHVERNVASPRAAPGKRFYVALAGLIAQASKAQCTFFRSYQRRQRSQTCKRTYSCLPPPYSLPAKVPTSAAAVCMVVYRTLASIERDWLDNWMIYLEKLDKEAQGMFANGVRAPKYGRQSLVMTNKAFTTWAMANGHMFAADKR